MIALKTSETKLYIFETPTMLYDHKLKSSQNPEDILSASHVSYDDVHEYS